MTLRQAAEKGIARLRKREWADPGDYMKITLIGELIGPWGELYAPIQEVLGHERPQRFLLIGNKDDDWEPYEGPLLETAASRGDSESGEVPA